MPTNNSFLLKSTFRLVLVFFVLCLLDHKAMSQQTDGLQSIYADYFTIGASVSPKNLENQGEKALILNEFGSLTAENVMKMGPIHPEPNKYNWEPADAIVNFAQDNQMKMRGHTLIWHNQHPDWFFVDEKGKQINKKELYKRMKQHITDVVTRYKGKIYAWDVVNEAISDNAQQVHREDSPFYKIAGEEYIEKAFEFAHEADPNALLFYNDYNATAPLKSKKIYDLVKRLKDKGTPIHGIGLQGHWNIFDPSEEDIRSALDLYSSLGLDIQITELDISVYKGESQRRALKEGENDKFLPELEQKQIEMYTMIFEVFRDYKEVISAITFWNVSDRSTWLDNFPVRGRKNYPLLFDQKFERKKAYEAVTDF